MCAQSSAHSDQANSAWPLTSALCEKENELKLSEIENNSFVRLIEFALMNKSFNVNQACQASGLSNSEFHQIRHTIFENSHPNINNDAQMFQWYLSPNAYFHYLTYIQYKHAVKTSNRAHIIAIISVAISIIVGIGSIASNFA